MELDFKQENWERWVDYLCRCVVRKYNPVSYQDYGPIAEIFFMYNQTGMLFDRSLYVFCLKNAHKR